MFKLFILLSIGVAFAYAAPGLLHATPILHSGTYNQLNLQPAVHVVHPVLTSHSVVRPIISGHGHYGHGYGHGQLWL